MEKYGNYFPNLGKSHLYKYNGEIKIGGKMKKLDSKLNKSNGNIKPLNAKVSKYVKIAIELFLVVILVSLYMVFKNELGSNNFVAMLIPGAANYSTVLSWVSLAILATGWIMWEFGVSKTGNKIVAIIGTSLIAISVILVVTYLSIIGLVCGLALMITIIVMEIPWVSKVKADKLMADNKQANDINNKKLADTLKVGK